MGNHNISENFAEAVALEEEAATHLTTLLKTALQARSDLSSQPDLRVILLSLTPIGLGGLIGVSQDTLSYIQAVRVKANASIAVQANTLEQLKEDIAKITQMLLTAHRTQLLQQGILHLELDEASFSSAPILNNSAQPLEQCLKLKVLYEFLKQSKPTEGVIQKISIVSNLKED